MYGILLSGYKKIGISLFFIKSVLLQRRPGFYVCHYIRSVRVRARVILHSLCPMQVDVACADVEQGRDKPCPYYATVGKLMLCAG